MSLSLKSTKKPDLKARQLLRSGKWKAALAHFEELAQSDEQDYAKWNLLGDIQFRAGDTTGAAASWQRALDGYVQESLHENALGIGRKIAKRVPEETAIHLTLSESYLGLEYYADAISSFRSFVKLCRQASNAEKKGWFRKVMSVEMQQPHLLEEITQLLSDCELEDPELDRDLKAYCQRMLETMDSKPEVVEDNSFEPAEQYEIPAAMANADGLLTIETGWNGDGPGFIKQDAVGFKMNVAQYETAKPEEEYVVGMDAPEEDIPDGQGKDHYDLGVVYAEMKLWDAAITEFQTARRDRSMRGVATLELARCFKNSNDPHRALRLLEDETTLNTMESGVQDELHFQMGVLNEALGNADAAAACFEKVSSDSKNYEEATRRVSNARG